MPDLLSNLTRFCQPLRAAGHLPDPAFTNGLVHGDILLDATGAYLGRSIRKAKDRPSLIPTLPARTSAVTASYLLGNRDYWTGQHGRALECRRAMQALHAQILEGVEHPAATAILSFLSAPPPATPLPDLAGLWGIQIDGVPAQSIMPLMEAWQRHYRQPSDNPTIRVMSGAAFSRLVSANMDSAESYGQTEPGLPPGVISADYGAALNWLLARPTTVRLDTTAIVCWVEGHPEIDPTPDLICYDNGIASTYTPPEAYPGELHVAALSLSSIGRVSLRYYHTMDGSTGAERIGTFRQRLLYEADLPSHLRSHLEWQEAFYSSPKRDQMVCAVIQAMLHGDRPPAGVTGEILRLNRLNAHNMGHRCALLALGAGWQSPPKIQRG